MAEWKDCTTIFSNGTEFEIFQYQCETCTKYRNGRCRTLAACYKAMFDKDAFPYSDLMDAAGGFGGKKCKRFTDEKPVRDRIIKQIDGQMEVCL